MSNGHANHILPLKVYLAVATALLTLTAITVIVAQFNFGEWNMVVAMLVAAFKATLVALFFMHLYYDNKMYMIVFVSSLLFLAIFIILTMFDTEMRGEIYPQQDGPIQTEAIIYRGDGAAPAAAAHDAADTTAAEEIDTTEAVDASDAEEDEEDWGVE